jgi:hypothetical protein
VGMTSDTAPPIDRCAQARPVVPPDPRGLDPRAGGCHLWAGRLRRVDPLTALARPEQGHRPDTRRLYVEDGRVQPVGRGRKVLGYL